MSNGGPLNTGASESPTSQKGRERRQAERYDVNFKLSISSGNPSGIGLLVEPAEVKNISRLGALMRARRAVHPDQKIVLAIPTEQCPDSMGLPKAFVGPAEVVRAEETVERKCLVALRFSEAISQNRDFAGFMDFIKTTAGKSPNRS